MFWRVGIARNAVFFHSFVASKARKGRSEKRELRRIGCPRCRQNLHHACARERFGSQNRSKLACRQHFWKLTSTKFAPRLRARTIRKSKSLKHRGFGPLLEVEVGKICTTPAREKDLEVKIVKTPGARDVFWGWKCVSRGRRRDFDTLQNTWQAQDFVRVAKRRGGFKEGLKRCVSRGRRRDVVVCDVDGGSIRRWNRGTVANFMSRKCYFAVIISRGSYRTSYASAASAQLFRGRRSTFEASTWKSLKRIGILRSSVCSTCQFWRKSRRNASFLIRFWSSKLRFWRKSRRKASFFISKASILKEVSRKSFVFELQNYIFEGSLAEKLRFWASKLHFWRKSRRIAAFLSFKASILKEVPQKSFVFHLESFNFEGSLAKKLRFWVAKLHFWRKSRRKASFLSFKASFFKEVSQNCCVFELQSFNFEGSLAEKLRFWSSKLRFWRKFRRKASFLSFKASILKEVSHKSFVWQNHLHHTPVDNQITWTSNHLTSKSLESQINWQPHHLKFKTTDNQNHLKHTSIDNHIIWISNQLTTKSIESQINWQPKSFESQINSQPNHLNLISLESDINSFSNQLNSARSLPIGSLSLETSATALCGRYVNQLYRLLWIDYLS